MKDTISYSEYLFLSALERCDQRFECIYFSNQEQLNFLGLNQTLYQEMVATLAEDTYIVFHEQDLQRLVGRLRGEIAPNYPRPAMFHDFDWANPREALYNRLYHVHAYRLRITYRGLRRLEELRELLKRDRILEPFGILLDMRYFVRDLEEALRRSADVPVSVMRLDLDGFKKINDNFSHGAGDIVMKSYLEAAMHYVGRNETEGASPGWCRRME